MPPFFPTAPGAERQLTSGRWYSWFDGDVVILNSNIPLEIFLPAESKFAHVNMLATNDRHGLNNGVYLIRVSEWALRLLSANYAFKTFRPEYKLKYNDQSAMEALLQEVIPAPSPYPPHGIHAGKTMP